jgi:hypothetical protein
MEGALFVKPNFFLKSENTYPHAEVVEKSKMYKDFNILGYLPRKNCLKLSEPTALTDNVPIL